MKYRLPVSKSLLSDPGRPLIHRDLSWIQFNHRVLDEAFDPTNPLIHRLRFLSITSSNFDEFFMIRFASLEKAIRTKKDNNLQRVRSAILKEAKAFITLQRKCFKSIKEEMEKVGIHFFQGASDTAERNQEAKEIFLNEVVPGLTRKNYKKNSDLIQYDNLQVLVTAAEKTVFEVAKTIKPYFLRLRNEQTAEIFLLEDLLATFVPELASSSADFMILRITKDADFSQDLPDTDSESIPELIRGRLRGRDKSALVRMQMYGKMSEADLLTFSRDIRLKTDQMFSCGGLLNLGSFFGLVYELPDFFSKNPSLSFQSLPTNIPSALLDSSKSIFEALQEKDILLHHPYDSFSAYIYWLEQACRDPEVIEIKQTIYRIEKDSRIIELLKEACRSKKVRVFLELRARFDEINNLRIAEELRQEGAEIFFGFSDLKLHAKVTQVTRREKSGLVEYCHFSTGNYNSKTARQYTDLSILTANQEMAADATKFFDKVSRKEVPSDMKRLVVAPTRLHQRIRTLIKRETEAAKKGKPARIFAKVNALVDEKIIQDLYLASSFGVKIDLVVRGACSLIPGVRGLSENIRVISIVDRFLEHSRIYYFESSETIYLSSADWMPRNFYSRLEIAFPVLDKSLFRFIVNDLIPGYMKDNQKARELESSGQWKRMEALAGINPHRAQEYFSNLASRKYEGTALIARPHEGSPEAAVDAQ